MTPAIPAASPTRKLGMQPGIRYYVQRLTPPVYELAGGRFSRSVKTEALYCGTYGLEHWITCETVPDSDVKTPLISRIGSRKIFTSCKSSSLAICFVYHQVSVMMASCPSVSWFCVKYILKTCSSFLSFGATLAPPVHPSVNSGEEQLSKALSSDSLFRYRVDVPVDIHTKLISNPLIFYKNKLSLMRLPGYIISTIYVYQVLVWNLLK